MDFDTTMAVKTPCALFNLAREHGDQGALDLSYRTQCPPNCDCLGCTFSPFRTPDAGHNFLKHWSDRCHFGYSNSPVLSMNPPNQEFNSEQQLGKRRRESPIPIEDLSNKRFRTSSSPESSIGCSPTRQGFANSTGSRSISPRSPFSTSSHSMSPTYDYYPSTYGTSPAFPGFPRSATFDPTPFSKQIPVGMTSPQPTAWDAFMMVYPIDKSPRSIKSSAQRTARSANNITQAMSSKRAPVAGSPGLSRGMGNETNPSHTGDYAYWQRRLRNNLAAKRSRDTRREREDRNAMKCQRAMEILRRINQIESEVNAANRVFRQSLL